MMRRRAFTLIELLAAMLITIIIMGALTSALYIGFRARNSANRAVNASRTLDLAMETIARDFRQIVPPKTGILKPISGTFSGDEVSITIFMTQMPMSDEQRGGVIAIDYLVNGGDLIRRAYSASNMLAETSEEGTDEVVVSGVTSFSLSYYDPSGAAWQTTWDSTSNTSYPLPSAVEMVLEFKESGKEETTRITRVFPISTAVPVYTSSSN